MNPPEREVRFVGVVMKPDENTCVIPRIPGWKYVAATRAAFGAQLIYEKIEDPPPDKK